MVGVDPEIGTSALRFWLATGSAALLVAAGVLVLALPQKRALTSVACSGIVVLGAILATSLAWMYFDRSLGRDRNAERQALETRAEQLTGRALAPGSALACLDATAGESVEVACEKALFASPASVAAATSYVAARLAVLSDLVAYAKRGGASIDNAMLPLRHSLEIDRFGFLAHALKMRDGCTSQHCPALELLHDRSHVIANLSANTLDHYLEHYQTVWAQPPEAPVAEAAHPEPTAMAQSTALGSHKVLVNIDFPTAASIPPISIMNPEPTGRVPPGVNAAAATNSNPPSASSPRRMHKQAANPPVQAGAVAAQAQNDPVWTPAVAGAPPPQTAATATATAAVPAANLASGARAPVQLNPFASSQ